MIKKIILLFMVLSVIPTVYAESGTISYSGANVINYTNSMPFTQTSYSFNYFFVDNVDYPNIQFIVITANAPTYNFAVQTDYTTFTCNLGCTGSGGYASFVNTSGGIFTWTFNTDTVITGADLRLTYARNIYSAITVITNIAFDNRFEFSTRPDSSHPVGLVSTAGGKVYWSGNTGGSTANTYEITAISPIRFDYNLSYLNYSAFNMQITKYTSPTSIPVKVDIIGSTHTYYTGVLDSISYNFEHTYCDGVILQSSGTGTNIRTTTINSTILSYSACGLPVPTPTVTINPLTKAGIQFDKDNYSVGEIGNIRYIIDQSIFNIGKVYEIEVVSSSRLFNPGTDLFTGLNIQDTLQYQFYSSGTYQTNLYSCFLTCFGHVHPAITDTLNSDTAQVVQPHPYINTPLQVTVGVPFIVNFSYNRAQTGTDDSGFITVKNSNGVIVADYIANVTITPQNISAVLHTIDTFALCLESVTSMPAKCTSIKAVTGTKPIITNVTKQYLNLTSSGYMYGDTISGSYAITNNNWSLPMNIIFDIYNYDNQIETMYGNINYQTDNFNLVIVNQLSFYFDGILEAKLNSNFLSGNNAFRILLVNDTSTIVILSSNFTLSSTNTAGYGLKLSKNIVNINEVVTAYIIAPSSTSLIITGVNSGKTVTYTFNSSSSMSFKFPLADTYQFNLFDSNNNIQANALLTVNPSNPTPTPTQPNIQARTGDLLNSNYFVIIVTLIAFASIGFYIGGLFGSIVGFSAGYIVLGVLGLMPLWAIFLFAIVVIVILAIMLGGKITGGNGE